SYLVAGDPARGAVFLVEETGVVARWGSSAYRRGALGAKTVASMVPSCPIGSMVPGGSAVAALVTPCRVQERSRLGDFTHSPPGPSTAARRGGSPAMGRPPRARARPAPTPAPPTRAGARRGGPRGGPPPPAGSDPGPAGPAVAVPPPRIPNPGPPF